MGLPSCLMARFILKSFVHLYPADDSTPTSTSTSVDMNTSLEITEDGAVESVAAGKQAKASTARITKLLRDPDQLLPIDPLLHSNLIHCLQSDFLTSPLTDQFRHQIGVEGSVHARQIDWNGCPFHSEAAMRAAGYPKNSWRSPRYPVEIDGHIVNWIESKALFWISWRIRHTWGTSTGRIITDSDRDCYLLVRLLGWNQFW